MTTSGRAWPSAVAELAWILDLLVQRAPYAEPALAELDRSLLPGVASIRASIRARYSSLWSDRLAGCPELLPVAAAGGGLEDVEIRRLMRFLTTAPRRAQQRPDLLSEPQQARRAIRKRLASLDADISLRRRYRDVLIDVWQLAGPMWERRGRAVAAKTAAEWRNRLARAANAGDVARLVPPRHPLTDPGLLVRRPRFSFVPLYFCMSGGLVADVGEELIVGVPASALHPIRPRRDASFVADRVRTLSEPTRVRILIHLLQSPAGVMEMTRALRMSQPTVSEHVRLLAAAGLIRKGRMGTRSVYTAAPQKVERLLEDARATLSRWSVGASRRNRIFVP